MASDFERSQMGYGSKIHIAFRDKIAILTMDLGENRYNDYFVDSMNAALDTVLE